MHVARRVAFHRTIAGLAIIICAGFLAGCAPLEGYPTDPENTAATLAALTPYFDGTKERAYFDPRLDPRAPEVKRNEIVLARMRAYDIEFADFERGLYGQGNEVTLSGDLAGLVLAGLIATTGNAATKAALGAAAIGVAGANTTISKDLYYQKTIPALLAQMEANRLKALAPITAGLKQSDADYSLMQAYIDLDAYKNAGSMPAAITAINQSAGAAKDIARAAIAALRSTPFVEDAYSQRMVAYIWPHGLANPDKTHVQKIMDWMSAHLPPGIPVETLIHSPALADARQQAVSDLSIP